MSSDESVLPPVLVLGIGNILLGDDGVGVHLINELAPRCADWDGSVELLEGGTQGLALLGSLAGRDALVLLDAVSTGAPAGTLHICRDEEVLRLNSRSTTAHESNAGELLAIARLLGDLPESIFLVGIEPALIQSGIGLSPAVQSAVPAALEAACLAVEQARICRKVSLIRLSFTRTLASEIPMTSAISLVDASSR